MHSWFAPPHVGQVVCYNDTKGIIADILNFVDNGSDYAYNIYDFVLVKFNDETISAIELGNLRPEPIIATTNDTEEEPPIIHDDWNWQLPFVVGQRVTLNPTHRTFYRYNQQSDNSLGTIVGIDPYIHNNWDDPDTLFSFIFVDWDNGYHSSYPINSLFPVGDIIYTRNYNPHDFSIGMQVSVQLYRDTIKKGWIVDINLNTIRFLDDSTFDSYCVNKDFVTIINPCITNIIAYTFPHYSTLYCPTNTQNPHLDELIFYRNLFPSSTEFITEKYPSPPPQPQVIFDETTPITLARTFRPNIQHVEPYEFYDEDDEDDSDYDEDDNE